MKKLMRFYKEDNRWYADVPEWTGSKADLEMVLGADDMLDVVSFRGNEKWVTVSDSASYAGQVPTLTMIKETPEDGGAEYTFNEWSCVKYGYTVWLCGVLGFVFGDLPKNIYIS